MRYATTLREAVPDGSGPRATIRSLALRALGTRVLASPPGVVFIYAHHVFDDEVEPLRAHLERCRELGFEFLPTSEAVRCVRSGEPGTPAVSLSFDDGYRNVFTNGLPVAESMGIPVTVFVASGFVGCGIEEAARYAQDIAGFRRPVEFARADDIRAAVRNGHTIGSHSVTHRNLATLDEEEFAVEIDDSIAAIEQWTGEPVTYFAWPFGQRRHIRWDQVVALRDRGLEAAFGAYRAGAAYDGGFVVPREHFEPYWPPSHLSAFALGRYRSIARWRTRGRGWTDLR